MRRRPAVADQFYPGNPSLLEKTVKGFLEDRKKKRAIAVISPHAGYIYSGRVAGAVFSEVEIPNSVILIGPNHTGLGENVAVMASGRWEMPFGVVDINEGLANRLLDLSPLFSKDSTAHRMEHSLEVQIPFLYYINPNVTIVPITIMPLGFERCTEIGRAIADVIGEADEDVLIVISSDMNHYESDKVTRSKDRMAIEKILRLDAQGLMEVTSERDITMCGVVPATIGIIASKLLKAREAFVVSYATSADVSGDYNHVVGYAGVIIR